MRPSPENKTGRRLCQQPRFAREKREWKRVVQLLFSYAGPGQPFTAPAMTPLTMYFWHSR